MTPFLRQLLNPLVLAGLISWLSVVLLVERSPLELAFLTAWLLGFLLSSVARPHPIRQPAGFALQAGAIIGLLIYGVNISMVPVLQVVLTAQLAMTYPLRSALLVAAALTVVHYFILDIRWQGNPLATMLGYIGFQLFAIMTAHYARTAEQATLRLKRVNAELLATRALLEHSARNGERLRMSRELHDVVGHKLTALRLNLHAIPSAQRNGGVDLAEQLSGEILSDIRGVVSALRVPNAMDIETAIRAVAQPFPRPSLRLDIEDGLIVDDPELAETILRIVQEAITNTAKHSNANTLTATLRREDGLRLDVHDDGSAPATILEGNGLKGIRERVESLGGQVGFSQSPLGGMQISARLP